MAKLGVSQVTEAIKTFELKSTKSANMQLKNYRIMLIGPSNEGKTTCAATASEFFPTTISNSLIELPDMRWILFDSDGLSGFRRMGIDVDAFDLSNVPLEHLQTAMKQALDACILELESGAKKTIVIDSISVLDKMIQTKVRTLEEKTGIKLWGAVLTEHAKIFSQIKSLPGNVICISHVTQVNIFGEKVEQIEKAKAKLTADGLEEGDLKMDISGQAYRFYKDNFSEIWAIKSYGNEPNRTFFLHPYGYNGMEAKTKQKCFDKKEPANIRLMIDKAMNVSTNVGV